MGPTTAKTVFGILFVAVAISVAASLGTTFSYSGIFCDPPFAPMVLLRWFVFFFVSVGLPIVVLFGAVLIAVWRLQHTFVQTMLTRRVFVFTLCIAVIAGAAPPLFITPVSRHVCQTSAVLRASPLALNPSARGPGISS